MAHLGPWAGITLVEARRPRRVDSAGVDEFVDRRGIPGPEQIADPVLRRATRRPVTGWAPEDPVFDALGVPEDSRARIRRGTHVLCTVPLVAPAAGPAVLAVEMSAPASTELIGDLDGLGVRAARALTGAVSFEQRATLARTLRQALVPAELPGIDGLQLAAEYRPAHDATQIGGDFYDVVPLPDGRWAFSIGDVCGKGVEAAVLTGQIRQSLRTAGLVSADPVEVLDLANRAMLSSHGSTFVTIVFGVLEILPDGVRIQLASAGHPPPLLLRGGEVTQIETRGMLLGILPSARFESTELVLGAGDTLLLYTDGATEARAAAGMLGIDPIVDILADSRGLSAQAIVDRVVQRVWDHLGGQPPRRHRPAGPALPPRGAAVTEPFWPTYWAAVENDQEELAVAVAHRALDAGQPVGAVVIDLVCRAQAEVGARWAGNDWSVADEHRATTIGEAVLAAVGERVEREAATRPRRTGRRIVLTCVDGEWHTLPSLALGTVLRAEGHRVTYLGASVSTSAAAQVVYDEGPDVFAVSCALPLRLFEVRRMIEVARSAGVPVLAGGRGMGPDGTWALTIGASAYAADALSAAALLAADALPATVGPAPALGHPPALEFLHDRENEIVTRACDRLATAGSDQALHRHRAEEDLRFVLQFLAAALLVDDDRLFTEFLGWFDEVSVARDVPTELLVDRLDALATAVVEQVPDCEPVTRLLTVGRAGLVPVRT